MSIASFRRLIFAVSCGLALASCSGGGGSPSSPTVTPAGPTQAEQPTAASASVATISLAKSAKPASFQVGGDTATLGIYSSGAKQNVGLSVSLPAQRTAMKSASSASANSCSPYAPPALDITNPFPFPVVLTNNDLKYLYILLLTKCNVKGDGYNVALNQIAPTAGAPTTIGDVIGVQLSNSLYAVTGFRPRATASYTFAPRSTSLLSFISAPIDPTTGYPYTNTQVVTFAPNTPTTLGAIPTESCANASPGSPGCPNGSSTQTNVALMTQTSTGGNASVACFNTSDPRFGTIPPDELKMFPGTVKGACEFNTGTATIALGTTVTFSITNPDPDTAHGFIDGPLVQVTCTQTTTNNITTATCPTTGPNGTGFTVGADSSTTYQYFVFGNDPGPAANVHLSPTWESVVAGSATTGYIFVLPTFPTYPVTMKIDGDVNNNLSMAEDSSATACPSNASQNDMTQIAPGTILVNCNSGHEQRIDVSYDGGTWQYQHNGVAGQNQDCDASCVAYAAIDLYDATGATLLQGDGSGATINGTSTALATINPLAVIDPVSGGLEDANAQTVNLPLSDTGSTATVLKVTEANINNLNDTNVVFGLTQPTYGPLFGLNVYYGGSQFVTSGNPFLPVGATNGLAHLPYGVGLDIQANALGGTGLLFITPPEAPGQHAGPSGIINVVIPQVGSSPVPSPLASGQALRNRHF